MKKGCSSVRMGWRVVALFLLMVCLSWPPAATAAPVYGGHGTVLNAIYPELWDPHMAGTIGPLAALSPLYNQLVEFNPSIRTKSLVTWQRTGRYRKMA